MTDTPEYSELIQTFSRVNKLDHALVILSWDQMVMMPPGGVQSRSESLAELSVMRHELLSDERVGDWISACEAQSDALSEAQQRSVFEMRRSYNDASCLPADLVKAKVVAGSNCEHGWRSQRPENDWHGFLKNFETVVSLAKDEAAVRQAHAGTETAYDALLDLHCRGDSSQLIDSVFGQLKAKLPGMIDDVIERQANAGITNNKPAQDSHYSVAEQTALSQALLASLGFDFNAGRLDVSAHPFSTGVRGDQRITTRYDETTFLDALLATAHETGHASYEAGLPDAWQGLPVGQSRNMCIHESQSLMFEKMVTLSDAFLQHLHGLIKQHLTAAGNLSYEQLKAQARRVTKSFIRVEADELTYPIHVALRYDIERDLINGKLSAKDIPEAWDAAMMSGLGLSTEGNYTNGCLQDIHWTDGTFGYFPSYTLGAVNSAQLFESLRAAHSDWEERFAKGDISFVRDWLSENIWQHGCHLSSQGLMEQATGRGTDASSLLNHLTQRYGG